MFSKQHTITIYSVKPMGREIMYPE